MYKDLLILNGENKIIKRFLVTSAITKEQIGEKIKMWFGENGVFCHYKLVKRDRPEDGKQYFLTGGHGQPCIAGGNTWSESVVK
jgi:hypothetical protein